MRSLLVAALLIGLPPAAAPAAAPAAGGLGIRLVDAPTALKDDPRARIYIIDHVSPGTTIRRHVAVSDTTSSPLSASLYVGGASISGDAFTPTDKGVPSELGSWSSVSPSAVSLGAGQSKEALVTIAVPADAADGERYGVIWAELPPGGTGPVKAVNRVGIRIYLSVGNGSAPPVSFSIEQLQAQRRADGVPLVRASVHNTGGRALDMNGTLSLSDGPGGLSGGPYPASLGTTLAIGATEPVSIVLPKAITGGPWKATLTLRSDTVSETVTASLTFPVAGQTSPPVRATQQSVTKSHPVQVFLAVGLVSLLALLLLAAALLLRRRGQSARASTGA
jgi:hypothetical protein